MNTRARIAAIAFLVASALSGCASGIAEFQHFDDAYAREQIEAAKVLDRLGAAERIVKRREIAKAPGIPDFDPDLALYYLSVGDPPITAAIRASLQSVTNYNAALSGLGSGAAAEALTARIGAASSSAIGASGAVAELAGGGAFAVPAQAALTEILPIFKQLAAIGDRAEFGRQMLAAYPDIRALLVSVRAGAPQMFELMKRSYVERGSLSGTEGVSDANLVKLEADRLLIAGWVILLDQTLLAMDAAAAAAEHGSSGNIAALVEASTQIRVLAQTIRTAQTR